MALNNDYNDLLFSAHTPDELVRRTLQVAWSMVARTTLVFETTTSSLTIAENDTIQTIHYYYRGGQLLKIIYFGRALRPVLERLGNWGPASAVPLNQSRAGQQRDGDSFGDVKQFVWFDPSVARRRRCSLACSAWSLQPSP